MSYTIGRVFKEEIVSDTEQNEVVKNFESTADQADTEPTAEQTDTESTDNTSSDDLKNDEVEAPTTNTRRGRKKE